MIFPNLTARSVVLHGSLAFTIKNSEHEFVAKVVLGLDVSRLFKNVWSVRQILLGIWSVTKVLVDRRQIQIHYMVKIFHSILVHPIEWHKDESIWEERLLFPLGEDEAVFGFPSKRENILETTMHQANKRHQVHHGQESWDSYEGMFFQQFVGEMLWPQVRQLFWLKMLKIISRIKWEMILCTRRTCTLPILPSLLVMEKYPCKHPTLTQLEGIFSLWFLLQRVSHRQLDMNWKGSFQV